MKRIIQILSFALAMFTFVGSVGVGVFTHFCHDSGVEQSFIIPQSNMCEDEHEVFNACCSAEVQAEESECCSDQIDFFQVEFENFENSLLFSFVPEKVLDIQSLDLDFTVASNLVTPSNYANPPPLRTGRQILIQHQIFRI
ncbi:MAG: hypothetical protein P8P77_08175 [Crocinitomicaceae bacterium]|nr:hypothetical protein [Crocinitomicaceae bacterium]